MAHGRAQIHYGDVMNGFTGRIVEFPLHVYASACDASRAVRLTVSRSQRVQCILSVQTRTLDRIGVLERSKASRGEADYSNSKVGERLDGGRGDARRPILEAGTGLCICTTRSFVELR